ncbi:uncharacterized protein LOC141652945 [Silene latifolia]|uniref:uncharacterized protein LOC141652945 n=1 Tax=Silene latifolia TaxID=37657 RepID=UPI003D78B035
MSVPNNIDVNSATLAVRRSPRLAAVTLRTPTWSPVARVEKLQVRRKLATVFDKEDSTFISEEGNDEGDLDIDIAQKGVGNLNGDDQEYWSEDSAFSQLDVGDTEVQGDLVEEEELFSNEVDEIQIDVVNKNLNQSCSKVGNSKLLDVDDLDVRIGEEADIDFDDDKSMAGFGDEIDIYDTFDPSVDFGRPIVLKKGLKFPSVEVYRKAVRQHAIENGYEPYFYHNESARVTIYCRYRCECPWNSKRSRLPKCTCSLKRKCKYRLYATKLNGENLTF